MKKQKLIWLASALTALASFAMLFIAKSLWIIWAILLALSFYFSQKYFKKI